MFTLTHSQERIDRLMGSAAMPAGDDWKIAAHVIDGMLENDSNNGGGTFATWTSATDALTLYADDGFFERMEIEKCDFIVVCNAVAAALTNMQTREKLQGFSDEYIAEVSAATYPATPRSLST